MRLMLARSFHRSRLPKSDQERCWQAIQQFSDNPRQPGLHYERLGHGESQNHCSIRASDELRVILAVEPEFDSPDEVTLVRMGHHDAAYEWSNRQSYHTEPAEGRPLPGASGSGQSITDALADIEDMDEWMLFLHPDQEVLVRRQYSGEARIRGGAGTGKTVIALHRTAELGRRYAGGRILFTTFSRSLTDSMEGLYRRLPDAPTNVDFVNIDRLASKLLPDLRVDTRETRASFDEAYSEVVVGTPLQSVGQEYLRAEIERVIKGRGATKEHYLDTDRFERLGRKRSFNKADRELCWELRECWDRKLASSGTVDFPDRVLAARDVAQQRHPIYRAAVIDEAQDLTTAGLQLARAVVAGAPSEPIPTDGLLILDDSAQRIYKGGTRPAWAGLKVNGRSEILRTNYRNTDQVMSAAAAVRGPKMPVRDDNDDGAARPTDYEIRDGPNPTLMRVGIKGEVPAVASEIRRLQADEGVAATHIAVLTVYNDDARKVSGYLQRHDIPSVLLQDTRRSGIGASGVRVGTFDRAKSLEFEAVLIPRLGQSIFPRPADNSRRGAALGLAVPGRSVPDMDVEAETRQLELDRLYVRMTRARRWLLLVTDESPCAEIEAAWEHFTLRQG